MFAVHLAMEEALVNAIKHGNRKDPAKTVEVVCHIAKDRVQIRITDEGSGFRSGQRCLTRRTKRISKSLRGAG